jgi:DNA end-binding protein Ku
MAAESTKAPTSTRALWKGAISFGLVHIPVGLYSATAASGIDFDWLDKRSMQPVGYKRVNKTTGQEIAATDIVKGVEFEDGRYVVLTPEEITAAFPKTTQTIEIEAFLDANAVPFVYLERPYYTAPLRRGEKVYALLREALHASHKVGVARVVIQSKQHLAVLIPCGRALVLNLLRWGGEIRSFEQLDLPPLGTEATGIKEAEMSMARQLIEDMTQTWDADHFRNSFADEIHRLVAQKASAGEVAEVLESGPSKAAAGADVVDLTALLKQSLRGNSARPPAKSAPASVSQLPLAPSAKQRPAKAKTAAAKKPARSSRASVSPAPAPAAKTSRRRA